ncbi:hypothetical protein MUK42_24533 [Musa troglodytarum]|uniref:Uncharacterized protein n=1 Tax=Musa troglodytarum TaxID=320322 RepID=A0A9E7K119_9LILI|nr:hypothetical protein MUK42_24533 [Musa troglodytarum]
MVHSREEEKEKDRSRRGREEAEEWGGHQQGSACVCSFYAAFGSHILQVIWSSAENSSFKSSKFADTLMKSETNSAQ